MESRGVNFPRKNGLIPLYLAHPPPSCDNFKVSPLPPQPICSTKSYKYDNYDKTKYKVSPYC